MKTESALKELNEKLRSESDLKCVFTNGVFDMLHPGHIDLLEFCKKQGDILVTAVNSDSSVRRLKGEDRPVYPLEERVEMLEALEFTDYVIPFEEDTPLELIKKIKRVDVLVKGGDYTPDQVVGRSEVESCGGKVLIFDFISSYSTSDIILKSGKKQV